MLAMDGCFDSEIVNIFGGPDSDLFSKYKTGVMFFKSGNFSGSLDIFESLLGIIPNHSMLYFFSGMCYRFLGKEDLVLERLDEALKLSPSDARLLVERGMILAALGKFPKAFVDFSLAIDMKLKGFLLIRTLCARAGIFLHVQDFENCAKDCNEALLIIKNSPKQVPMRREERNIYFNIISSLYYLRGTSYYEIGEPLKAVDDITTSLSVGSIDVEGACAFVRGRSLLKLLRVDEAIRDLEKAVKLGFVRPECLLALSRCYAEKEMKTEKSLDLVNLAIEILEKMDFVDLSMYRDSLIQRGSCFVELRRYLEAALDFERACSISAENVHPAHDPKRGKGIVLHLMGYKCLSLQAHLSALKNVVRYHFPSAGTGLLFSNISIYYGIFGNREKSNLWSTNAINFEHMKDHENEKYRQYRISRILQSNANASLSFNFSKRKGTFIRDEIELERIFSDFGKYSNSQVVSSSGRYSEMIRSLETYLRHSAKNISRVFVQDRGVDESDEKNEILRLREVFSKCTVDRMKLFRKIGGGSFGCCYLCRVMGDEGVFVLKVFHNPSKVNREFLTHIPYHRNIVPVLSEDVRERVVPISGFPDPEVWKRISEEGAVTIRSSLLFLKYYPKDLGMFMEERSSEKNRPFSDSELILMIGGLLRGVKHLHDNSIVHRDLHPKNVFVDAMNGRILIGDFGCCLNVKNCSTGFKIHKSDDMVKENSFSSFVEIGGLQNYLSPEVRRFDEEVDEYINYSKNDLFSVGVICFSLILTCRISFEKVTIGLLDSLDKNDVDVGIVNLTKNLLVEDPEFRIDYGDAVVTVNQHQSRIVQTTEHNGEDFLGVNAAIKDIEQEVEVMVRNGTYEREKIDFEEKLSLIFTKKEDVRRVEEVLKGAQVRPNTHEDEQDGGGKASNKKYSSDDETRKDLGEYEVISADRSDAFEVSLFDRDLYFENITSRISRDDGLSRDCSDDFVLLIMNVVTNGELVYQDVREFSFPVDEESVEEWTGLFDIFFFLLPHIDVVSENWSEISSFDIKREALRTSQLFSRRAYLVCGVTFEEDDVEKKKKDERDCSDENDASKSEGMIRRKKWVFSSKDRMDHRIRGMVETHTYNMENSGEYIGHINISFKTIRKGVELLVTKKRYDHFAPINMIKLGKLESYITKCAESLPHHVEALYSYLLPPKSNQPFDLEFVPVITHIVSLALRLDKEDAVMFWHPLLGILRMLSSIEKFRVFIVGKGYHFFKVLIKKILTGVGQDIILFGSRNFDRVHYGLGLSGSFVELLCNVLSLRRGKEWLLKGCELTTLLEKVTCVLLSVDGEQTFIHTINVVVHITYNSSEDLLRKMNLLFECCLKMIISIETHKRREFVLENEIMLFSRYIVMLLASFHFFVTKRFVFGEFVSSLDWKELCRGFCDLDQYVKNHRWFAVRQSHEAVRKLIVSICSCILPDEVWIENKEKLLLGVVGRSLLEENAEEESDIGGGDGDLELALRLSMEDIGECENDGEESDEEDEEEMIRRARELSLK